MTPDLVFFRAPQNKGEATVICIVHKGEEINIPLNAPRLSILLEDGQRYIGKFVRSN